MAEPPYGEIADLRKKGEIVPFLGAGVNFGTRPPGAAWDEATAAFLPSGAELSRYLASKVNFPSQDPHDLSHLAKVSSYYAEMLGRGRLRERLNALFCREFNLCDIHTCLAEVAAHAPLLVVTDQAIQRTPTATGRTPDAPAITVQAATAAAQISNFRVTSVRADVAPDVITSCPTTLRLQGAIEVSQPGTLYYRWERSDGVLLSPVDLTVTAAGTKTVTDTWAINYLASAGRGSRSCRRNHRRRIRRASRSKPLSPVRYRMCLKKILR